MAPHVARGQPRARGDAEQLRTIMGRIAEGWKWVRSIGRRRALEDGLDEEIRFHIDQQTEKLRRAGLSPDEARRQARLKFGGLEGTQGARARRDPARAARGRDPRHRRSARGPGDRGGGDEPGPRAGSGRHRGGRGDGRPARGGRRDWLRARRRATTTRGRCRRGTSPPSWPHGRTATPPARHAKPGTT